MSAHFIDPLSVRQFKRKWLGAWPMQVFVRRWHGECCLTRDNDYDCALVGIYDGSICPLELQADAEFVARRELAAA